jgi:molybdopterin molybdotransferase
MINVQHALDIVRDTLVEKNIISKKVSPDLISYIVAQNIYANFPIPHFRQSSMDGYALNIIEGLKQYKIVGEIPAGNNISVNLNPGEAVRIFTGSNVPKLANSIVIQEKVKRTESFITLNEPAQEGENIRTIGSQIKKGELVMAKSHKITPASIGLLRSLGIEEIKVFKKPSVAIVVTGDELITGSFELTEGKVFESNGLVLTSALQQLGILEIQQLYAKDSLMDTKKNIIKAMKSDVVLISGGISVGDYDFVQKSLEEINVTQQFYKVNQKPGKPLYFGTKNNKIVFALPGNPASTLSCFYIYCLPLLQKIMGYTNPSLTIRPLKIQQNFQNRMGRSLFLKSLIYDDTVKIIDESNSATLKSFSMAEALVFIPEEITEVKKGAEVKAWILP